MRILITGGLGQLGRALQQVLAEHDLVIVDLPDTDITDRAAITREVHRVAPELVIHCAAFTDVDACAKNPEMAYRINALGTQNVALSCQKHGAVLLHLSTNEVFAGDKPQGYEEWMPLKPINAYGRSKAAAEIAVGTLVRRAYIVRTSWLYAPGGRNFIHAIMAKGQSEGQVRVVADEIANPTYVMDLAIALRQLIHTEQYGTYHLTNSGACSRWAFADEILKLAGLDQVENIPILGRDYKRASTPPPYAALNNTTGSAIGIVLKPWQEALREYMEVNPPAP